MPRLKPLHERFAIEYIRTSSNSEAYRRTRKAFAIYAYKPGNERFLGYQMKNYRGVSERIDELRAQMAKRADISLDKLVDMASQGWDMAKLLQKPGEMISAVNMLAKLCGFGVERHENINIDANEPKTAQEVIERVAEQVGPEAALALATAFGLDYAETAKEKAKEAPEPLMAQTPPTDAVN
jgi:hypothetical protein